MQNTVNYKIYLRPIRILMCATALVPFALSLPKLLDKKRYATFAYKFVYTCVAVCLIFMCFFIRLSRISQEIAELSGDILSNGVEFIGFTILALIHLILSLESTWSKSSFDEILLSFERICYQFRNDFNVRFNENSLYCFIYVFYAHLIFCISFAVIVAFVSDFRLYNPTYYLVMTYSEIALKLKMVEIQILVLIVADLQRKFLATTKNCITKWSSKRFEPWPALQSCVAEIYEIQKMHAEIWNIVRLICKYLAWSLPSLLFQIHADISLCAYWSYLHLEADGLNLYVIHNTCETISDIIELTLICCLCEWSQNLDKQLALELRTYSDKSSSTIIASSLRRLSLQLCHEPILYTAGSFVDVNISSLSHILISTTANVVIIIQIRLSVQKTE